MAGKEGRRGWGWLRRLPSGRWHASYIDPHNGVTRHNAPRTYTEKIDAEGWLSAERRLIELGTWTPPAQRAAERKAQVLTLADYGDRWIKERRLEKRTRDEYTSKFARLIKPALGPVPLAELTSATVRTWYAGLGDTYPTRNAHTYQLLHSICETAEQDGLIVANPCNIRGAMNAPTKRKPGELTVAEVSALADAITERFKALVLLAAWCGLRFGEVIELRRKDLTDDASLLTVCRGATHRKGCHIAMTKQKQWRTATLPPHIRADIKHHLDTFVDKDPEAKLFAPDRGGCHLNDKVFVESYFRPALEAIGRKSGKEDIVVHDLKHFAGTQTARVANLPETMARLGHRTQKASLVYQQVASGRDAQIAADLSKLAEGSHEKIRGTASPTATTALP
ncbi:integrase [Mycobacterium malmoense]|uniref:tyrosine-type recombinase/integrase n=1 Tax=Mycobacterium malmoense TaxID=1780 RepID=UPI00080B2406|nr:site-specific integrase [Mycobacterium malmoense]OCB38764.1 integrase [Mycobacterium malmoense]